MAESRDRTAPSATGTPSLAEATSELRKDVVIQEALGAIYDEFIDLKEAEWNEYHKQVSQWEIDRYLTMF